MTVTVDGPAASASAPGGSAASPGRRPPGRATTGDGGPSRGVWRLRLFAASLCLMTLAFIQDPGRVAADTKLDLNVTPGRFLERALNMWEPLGFAGQLQNQSYGYLWPMGPFYWLGHQIGLSPWIVQRLWWTLLMVVAFLGMVRLIRLLAPEVPPWARLIAGLAFALSPRVISSLGTISIEAWPLAMAPWVLIPLIIGSRRGSVRRWAALSALAVASIGGVNAVATAAVLPLAGWFLLTRSRGPRKWPLIGWWSVCVILATLWWTVPLWLLGKYSPPFLDWIESASVTTLVTSPAAVLRGTSQWLPYLAEATGPTWQAGWALVAQPVLIVTTGAIAVIGLAGLALRALPERLFLVGSTFAGFALVGLGHVSEVPALSGLGAQQLNDLLDGPLAPIRNVHKFDLLLRVPLSVAFAVAIAVAAARVSAWAASRSATQAAGSSWRVLVPALAGALVVISAWPLIQGQATRSRSFVEIPGYWNETADWLGQHSGGNRALIVPGASFGSYLWGRSQDEPLQALATSPWTVRDAIPLSNAGNIRLLDSIETRLATGQGGPALAQVLSRSGLRYLVVRNDLDVVSTGAPRAVLVHEALQQTPGIERVASFGPVLDSDFDPNTSAAEGLGGRYPAVEIYAVAEPGSAPTADQTSDATVALRPLDEAVRFTGSADALLPLADSALLGPGPAVTVQDAVGTEVAGTPLITTDVLRRIEVNYGAMRNNTSQTLTADDPFAVKRAAHDYLPDGVAAQDLAVAQFDPVVPSASSSGSTANALRGRSPASQPWAAIDGDGQTAWVAGSVKDTKAPWWQADFAAPVDLASPLQVSFGTSTSLGVSQTEVLVTTDQGSRATTLKAGQIWQQLSVPAGETTTLRITGLGGQSGRGAPPFGIREVVLGESVRAQRVVKVPGAASSTVVLTARPVERSACAVGAEAMVCAPGVEQRSEERAGIDRVVEMQTVADPAALVRVIPRPGEALNRLVTLPGQTTANATSQRFDSPAARAGAAVDGDVRTSWQAADKDSAPVLTLDFPTAQKVRGVRLVNRAGLNASAARTIVVRMTGPDGSRYERVPVRSNGVARWKAFRATSMTIEPIATAGKRAVNRQTGELSVLPWGVSEVQILGPGGVRLPFPEAAPTKTPCGFGPEVRITPLDSSGRPAGAAVTLPTTISTTLGDIVRGRSATATSCGTASEIPAGRYQIEVTPTQEFLVTSAAIGPSDRVARGTTGAGDGAANGAGNGAANGAGNGAGEAARVVQNDPAHRVVQVSPSDQARTVEMTENFNAGWQASVDGQSLTPIEVDGWRQAFILPAGVGGNIEISYGPNTAYQGSLVGGAVAVAVVLVLAAVPGRRPGRTADAGPLAGADLPIVTCAVGAAPVVVAFGPVGFAVAAAGAVFALVPRLRPWIVAVVGGGMAIAVAAANPWPGSIEAADWVTYVQTLGVALASGAVLGAVWRWRPRPARSAAVREH